MVITHSPRPGEATGGVQNQVWKKKGNLYREWVSDFESGRRTHPANHIPRNRQQRRRRRRRTRGDEGAEGGREGGGRYSEGTPKWECFSVWGECSQALTFACQQCAAVRESVYIRARSIFCQSVLVF